LGFISTTCYSGRFQRNSTETEIPAIWTGLPRDVNIFSFWAFLQALRLRILAYLVPAKLLKYFSRSDKSNMNQSIEKQGFDLLPRDGEFYGKLYQRRFKTSSVGQIAGLLILRSSVRSRQKLKKLRTQIYMDLNYIDHRARVLLACCCK